MATYRTYHIGYISVSAWELGNLSWQHLTTRPSNYAIKEAWAFCQKHSETHSNYVYAAIDNDTGLRHGYPYLRGSVKSSDGAGNRLAYREDDAYSVRVDNITNKEDRTMHLEKPLIVPKDTIVQKIKDNIETRRQEAKEAHDKAVEGLQGQLDEVKKALENNPLGFLAFVKNYFGSVRVPDATRGEQGFSDMIAENYKQQDAGFDWKDEHAEKLLSVLEAATNSELEITENSDLYRYL